MSPGLSKTEFERFFVELERPLYNVAYRWLWSREDAAEVVQEAFVRLWKMRARVEAQTAKALVYKIALNLASSRRRRRASRRLRLVVSATPRESPDEALVERESAARVRAALERLPEAQRRVVVLCELGGLSYAEVAEILEIKVGTVGSRRNSALAKLREQLESEHP